MEWTGSWEILNKSGDGMSIEMTDDLQKIVDQKVETGEYDSATAVVSEAL